MILKLARISDGRRGTPSLPSMQSWAGTSTKSLNKYLPRTGQPALFACAGGRAHRRGYIGLPTEIFGRLSASVNLIHNNDGAAYLLPFLFLFHFLPVSPPSSLLPMILPRCSHQEFYLSLKRTSSFWSWQDVEVLTRADLDIFFYGKTCFQMFLITATLRVEYYMSYKLLLFFYIRKIR